MDSTIIASIIGAFSAITAAVIAVLLPHHLKDRKSKSLNIERSASREPTERTIKIKTWAGRKEFEYSGSVKQGTNLYIGESRQKIRVSADTYQEILKQFSGKILEVGATKSSDSKPGTLDEWLKNNVTSAMISTYVASVLRHELYASNASGKIKFNP